MNELATARSRKRKGYLHLAMAALTCPCNGLIFLAIFGGAALGAFLSENLSLFLLGLTVICQWKAGGRSKIGWPSRADSL